MPDTPRGVKALLFEEASLKERFEETIIGLFRLWGYSRVTTPAVEYLSVLSKGLDEIGKKRVITFSDPAGGVRPLALRSDVTPQIARIAATTLKNRPHPLRLAYAETVYRLALPGQGQRMEVYQAGAELIGVDSAEADAELIAMGIESMARIGYDPEAVKVTLSHVGYVRAVIDELVIDAETEKAIAIALNRKDTKGLSDALNKAGVSGPARESLETIPHLFGAPDLLGRAPAINDKAKKAIKNCQEVVAVLDRYGLADRINVDLSEVRGFGYYTGVTFEAFVKGIPKPVFSGGRYDNLLSAYGADFPATGFAVDIDHLLEYSSMDDWTAADILVVAKEGKTLEAANAAKNLRKHGLRVARDIGLRGAEESIKIAGKMKIPVVVVTDTDMGNRDDKVRVINIKTGEDKTISARELFQIIST